MTVAEMIKKTRTEANMTQGEYGAKFGVSRQTVSSWENGRSLPDLQMLIDICNTYLEESFLMILNMMQKKKNIYMNHFLRYSKINITMKKKFAG